MASDFTDGYWWGVAGSVISVLAVNFAFRTPYFAFNFTIPENIFSGVVMLVVSFMTSTLTTRVKKQEQLRMESETEKMRANLLRAVSHDLRTPLTSIYGSCSTVIDNYDSLGREQKIKLLSEACADAQWLNRMVENLLSVTRIDADGVAIQKTPTVLEELVDTVLVRFRVQEIMEPGGIYYGENAISGNLLQCNRANLLNQSTIITGVPGSGKSFSAKELIVFLALATKDDILICDPEREYYALGQALGGEVIRIAAGSPDHINAMDMVEGYGDGGNPVVDKSEFILSLFEQLDRGGIGPLQKSIIDRCVDAVYAAYKRGGPVPTLRVLREKLLAQPEEEARDLALALELFTTGSLDAFAHETNVDTQNRIVIYDIMDLGRQLKTMGLLIITDAMLNRVTENWRKGKRTHLFIDEFHVVFQNPYSADFFDSAWRRFRKRGAYPTAITQNVEYLLDSVQASTMLSNSEMLILLNQAPSDREKLAALLNISPEQTGYITNAPAGCGLLRYGGALVPFKNQFPKDTELYRLMTTKPDESIIVGGNTK